MKVVVQRVKNASVTIEGSIKSSIGQGLLVLLGVGHDDGLEDVDWLARKLVQMRIFNDEAGAMNLSVQDVKGEMLVISQFTLHASTKKGNRPSFIAAAKPAVAIPLYEAFIKATEGLLGQPVGTGSFGANMQVNLLNDGPVTIVIDSKNKV